jgi:hypothetical protein
MDRKERWQASRLHAQIVQGTFTEEDVFALLMILREYSARGSPLRECADFIAHREKDRGQVFEYLERTKTVLDNLGKPSTVPIFSLAELKACLDSCLAQFGLAAIDEPMVNYVLICIISLLQDVRLVKRDGTSVGVLEVAISKTDVVLLGNVRLDSKPVHVVFPALVAANDFMVIPEASTPIVLEGISWAGCQNGKMSLVQQTGG